MLLGLDLEMKQDTQVGVDLPAIQPMDRQQVECPQKQIGRDEITQAVTGGMAQQPGNAPCRQHQIDRWPRSGKNDKLLWRQHHPTQGKTETGWTDNKRWGQTGQQYPHQQVAAFMQAGAQKP